MTQKYLTLYPKVLYSDSISDGRQPGAAMVDDARFAR